MSKSEKLAWSLVGLFAGLPITWVVRGYVLSKIWLWFVASQFGLPSLNIPQAIGGSMLISLITYQYAKPVEDDLPGAPLIRSLLLSLLVLGLAALISLFL